VSHRRQHVGSNERENLTVNFTKFYPRDAMLARVLAMTLCLSAVCLSVCVCHKSVFYPGRDGRIDLVFGM